MSEKIVVRPNFYNCLNELQRQKQRNYSWAEVGRSMGISRQATLNLFTNEATDDSFIKYGTLASLLSFFAAEGMPITISDLFVVSEPDS